jgi:predicted lipoprotein
MQNSCFLLFLTKKRNMKYTLYALTFSLLFFVSCGGDDSTEQDPVTDNFNREVMLVHWADNFILPGYTDLETSLNSLEVAAAGFTQAPTAASLANVRSSWLTAYNAFQAVSMFEIGRAEQLNFRNRLNVYPTDTNELSGLISSGSWNLELPSAIDVQGFPALDYLLFGLGTDDVTIASFSTVVNALNYKAYLTELIQIMKSLTSQVKSDWSGQYRETYVANTSSSAAGSVDQTGYAFLFYYEKALRAGKVGIPAGVFSGRPLSQNVEGLYSKQHSKQLLETALGAAQNFFNGNGITGTNGNSLNAYLDTLNTVKNGSDLSSLINSQFQAAQSKIDVLQANFADQIESDNAKMLESYDELQRNVVLLKVDMLQALSIDVNYVDADGD